MTTLSITIPDEITPRVIDGFCKQHNYAPVLEDGSPNPETKGQFIKRKIIEFVRDAVREAEIQDARNTAAEAAAADADSKIVIT